MMAGLAAAEANNANCGVGVAFSARISGMHFTYFVCHCLITYVIAQQYPVSGIIKGMAFYQKFLYLKWKFSSL